MMSAEPGQNFIRPIKIMIVEEYSRLANLLGTLLKSEGHEVLIVTSAKDALVVAAAFRANFYIIDIDLGNNAGRQLGKFLRKQPEGRNACFISIMDHAEKDGIAQSKDAGFDLHLVKPFEIDVLSRFIATHNPAPADSLKRS